VNTPSVDRPVIDQERKERIIAATKRFVIAAERDRKAARK